MRATRAREVLEIGTSNGYSTVWLADAVGETLRSAPDAGFDFVFLEAERPAYVRYWPDLVRVLRPSALLVVDNVVSHADQVAEFRSLVSADDRVTDALAPIGAGALLIAKEPAA